MKTIRDASHLLFIFLPLLLVYFLALTSLLISSIYLVAFYTCLCAFFSSIVTEFEGCSLVHNLWYTYAVMCTCMHG